MNITKSNLQESIYHKLKNLAISKKRPTQEILRYFAMERFLYRLGVSEHRKRFFLKGGLMLMVWNPSTHRATVDIDLLLQASNSKEQIRRILEDICTLQVVEDGIQFDCSTLNIAQSQIEAEYTGLSARFLAYLHSARLPLRLDIGFSDKIFPEPANIEYPSLLDLPSPELRGYTPETMIAEKLDAMIRLGLANSRMKDFFDIWTLLQQFKISREDVSPIIRKVFNHRKTLLEEIPKAFTEAFYTAPRTVERWHSFLKGIGHDFIPLDIVVSDIRDFFLPILTELGYLQALI